MNNEKQRRGKEIFFAEKKNFLPSAGCESGYQARMNMNGSGAAFFNVNVNVNKNNNNKIRFKISRDINVNI